MRQNDFKQLKNGLLKPYFVAVLCLLSACNSSKPDIINEVFADKQAAISQTVQDIFKAGKAKDFERLAGFHLNSPKFSKYEDGNLKKQNAAENNEGEKAAFGAADTFNYSINDLKVDVYDKVAIATFNFPYDARFQGTVLKDTALFTLVFVDVNGQWKITHEHISSVKK